MKIQIIAMMKKTFLISLIISVFAMNAFADTHYVSYMGSDTYPYTSWATAADNIQSAVYAAAEGDTVIVDNGTYYQGERIMVTNEITVSTKNGADMTSVDGENSYGCFRLGTNSVVDGFTITNGNDGVGGGVMCWGGGTVKNCIIGGNYASSSGGGVWIREGGTVRSCTISENISSNSGAGVECFMGGAVLTNCVISDNWAYLQGGGVSISGNGTVQNCTISRNYGAMGGGVHCDSGALIVNSIISGNSANDPDVIFFKGGGVYFNRGGIVSNCTIIGNQAGYGGGMYCSDGGEAIHCKLTDNIARFTGGGGYCSGGTIDLCIFTQNLASNSGGGVILRGGSTLNNSLVYDNRAVSYNGGGVDCNGDANINNCTISSNTAGNVGGGFYCRSYINGTNSNCIIYHNTTSSGDGYNCYIDYHYYETNYLFRNCCTIPTNNLWGGTECIDGVPEFVDMYVGDFRLTSISPCINAGNNAYKVGNYDLDGNARISGDIIDMGAYEYVTSPGGGPYKLFVQSENPSGIAVDASPNDISGLSDGTTTFIRTYYVDVTVNLTAPGSAGGNDFSYWLLDGVIQGGSENLAIYITNDCTAKAVYGGIGDIYYVSHNGTHVYPYESWGTAATNIQAAVNAASDRLSVGATVLVTNGMYYLSSRIVVTNSVNVKSVNGAAVTHINGNGADGCFLISDGTTIDGFTITNGYTLNYATWESDGAGVYCDGGGIIKNCTIIGNEAMGAGGGVRCYYGGTVMNCSIVGNDARKFGGGVNCNYGGSVSNCIIMGNTSLDFTDGKGGGIYCWDAGDVSLCTISGNSAGDVGGGIYIRNTTVNNCAIFGNSAGKGGGVYSYTLGLVNNCTISGNEATYMGGGIYCNAGIVHNSIAYFNNSPDGANYYNGSSSIEYEYCCLTPDPGGTGNITVDPEFVDKNSANYRLSSSSPCINAGTNIYAVGSIDLDGLPRITDGTVDMGAYEYIGNQPGINILTVESQNPNSGVQIGAIPEDNYGNTDGITSFIRIYSNDVMVNLTAPISIGGNDFSHWMLDGNNEGSNTDLALTMISNRTAKAVYTSGGTPTGDIYYVSLSGAHTYPYTNWSTAANDIQSAVDAAAAETGAGAMVLVTNGTYILSSRIIVTNSLNVRSVSGAAVTHVNGNRTNGCFLISSGTTIDGFTITNGYATGTGWEEDGGGVYCDEGGGVQNCVITGNESDDDGGGIFCNRGGTIVNCSVLENAAGSDGGGVGVYYDGVVSNCIIKGNTATKSSNADGGGIECYNGGTVSHCTISDNIANDDGGGIWNNSGTVNLCTISANRADDGGGIWCNDPCVVSLCTISGNSAVNRGGGIYNQNTTINNCVVVSNSADYGGGVMCQTESRLNNCTISGNEATTQGGGVYCYENCSVHNSIVYFNSSPEGPDYYSLITGNEYEYCCLTPDPGGTGNITTDPKFVDKNSDNYRLSSSSPCINQGNNSYAAGNYDLNGLPRIIDGTVDMGAYEYIGSQPGIHTLTVESQNPDSGVQIDAAPTDNYGSSDGVTTFIRIYSNGVTVYLTAPINAGGNNFNYWLLDGVESETNTILAIPMITNRIVKAVYGGGGAVGSLMPTNPVPANGEVDVPTYQLLLWQLATNGTPAVSCSSEIFNTAITPRAFSTEMLAGNQPLFTTVDNQDNSGTGNPDDDMDVSLGPGDSIAPIEFDISYTNSTLPVTAQLLIYAKDIDETEGEIDDVYFNGTKIGSLTGENMEWSTTVFDIDPSLVVQGNNLVKIEIAVSWVCTVDWGRLVINNESAGDANIRYAEQNKPVYAAGESVITSIDLDTIAASQAVKLEVNILEPAGTNIAGTTVNRTLTGRADDPFDVTLNLPGNADDGVYHIQLLLYDISNQFQTLRMIPFGVGNADVITYDVFFGSASNTMAQIKTNLTYAGCFPGMLTGSADYWWQVIAKDASEQGTGSYWSFTTGGSTTPPSPPLNITASDGAYTDRIIISWDASGGADKYRVFRDGTNIAEVTDISYSDMSVTLWQNYNYYVQAGNAVGWSANSASNTGYAGDLSPPTGITASDGMFDDRIRVTWNASVGATKYQLYRDGKIIANVTDSTYDDMSVVQWQSYDYTVKAGNDYVWTPASVDSDAGYAGDLAPPTGVAASDGTYANRVRITWNPSAGATSYRLYRDGIQIDEITGTSYDDMSITLWQTYNYSVKAGNGLQWTPESNIDTGYAGDMAPPDGITASDGVYTDRIRISWNATAGATKYRIFRDGTQIAETSSSTYDDMNVVLWQTYNYSVSAGNNFGWTPQSTNDSGYAGDLITPANFTASDGLFSDRVRVTWNASAGATKYRIYRDDTQIAEITGTTYDDISVTAWQSYKYFVKAGNTSGWTPPSISDTGYAGDMAPPSGVDASDGKYTDRVRITWNTSSGATKYRVFRNGLYLAETTGTTYDDTSVTQWQTYEYSVKAGNSSFWTPSSVPNTGYAGSLVPPDEVAASDGIFSDRVYITWTSSSNAVKYSIYRDGVYLAETTATNYNDTTVTPWQTYEYCVKAGNISGWTPCSQADTGYAGNMAPPTDIAASDGLYTDRVRVTWNTSSGATKYQVFRDNLYIADTIGTSFDDTTVLAWQVYTYTVKAGNSSFWTPHSAADSGYAGDIAPPSGINASDGLYSDRISITWNPSAGATKYELYRDNLYITETTGTTYNDMSIYPAQLYSYSVRAGNSSFWTPAGEVDSGYAKLTQPTNIFATDGTYNDKVDVTWSNVAYATAYNIYRSKTNDAFIAALLGTSTSNIYSDTTVTPGVNYFYWIKATAEVGNSEISASDSGYAAIGTPTDVDASDGIYNNMVRVTWSPVAGVTLYKVYRGTTDVSTAASMIDESTSPYDDTSVKPAKMYYYWIKSSSEAEDSSFSEVDEGYAFKSVYPMISLGKWKVKNGKKTSKIIGKGIEELTTYLTDGCLIGIRDKDSTNIIDGPRILETKVKKKTGEVKLWFFKLKKNAVIKYKVKKSKLIYKIWKNFPINPVIFLVPSGTSNNLSNQSLEFYLEPIMGQTNDIGWQDMKSIVVEPEGM